MTTLLFTCGFWNIVDHPLHVDMRRVSVGDGDMIVNLALVPG